MQKEDGEGIWSLGCGKTGFLFGGWLARLLNHVGQILVKNNVCVASAGMCCEVLERQRHPFRETHHGVHHLWEDLPAQHFWHLSLYPSIFGAGSSGPYTHEAGFWAYYEVTTMANSG